MPGNHWEVDTSVQVGQCLSPNIDGSLIRVYHTEHGDMSQIRDNTNIRPRFREEEYVRRPDGSRMTAQGVDRWVVSACEAPEQRRCARCCYFSRGVDSYHVRPFRPKTTISLTVCHRQPSDFFYKRLSTNKMTWPYWDVYLDCLFPLGFGRPLWHPFGEEGAVLLGDVGWIENGRFCPLFNSMCDKDHAVHFVRGVPRDFRPITESRLFIERRKGKPWGRPVGEGAFLGVVDLAYERDAGSW